MNQTNQDNYKTKITRDDKKKEFTIAGFKRNKPIMVKTATEMMYLVDPTTPSPPSKEVFKVFGDKFGISAAKLKLIHNAIVTEQWLDPVRDLSRYFAFNGVGGRMHPALLERVHKYEDELRQAEKDGINHVTPILFYTGKSPSELKKELGKSLWKALCKNSFTRNLHIGKASRNGVHGAYRALDTKGKLKIINSFPSSHLKRGGNSPVSFTEAGLWVLRGCGQGHYNTNKPAYGYSPLESIYTDTRSMAGQLGKTFNPEWGVNTMRRKHEEYTNLITLRKYSPDSFGSMKEVSVKELSVGDYSATLLDNALAIRTEGEAMKHCVGSYSERCRLGEYVVYSITKDGKRSSTLGLYREDTKYTFSQHYGHCNKRIMCEGEKTLATKIIKELNNG